MNDYTINFATKMGFTAKKSEKVKAENALEAKKIALEKMNGDTYTVSILDRKNRIAFHYGYTGVSLGQNKI